MVSIFSVFSFLRCLLSCFNILVQHGSCLSIVLFRLRLLARVSSPGWRRTRGPFLVRMEVACRQTLWRSASFVRSCSKNRRLFQRSSSPEGEPTIDLLFVLINCYGSMLSRGDFSTGCEDRLALSKPMKLLMLLCGVGEIIDELSRNE